jgi:hypothetical protein
VVVTVQEMVLCLQKQSFVFKVPSRPFFPFLQSSHDIFSYSCPLGFIAAILSREVKCNQTINEGADNNAELKVEAC